jgi:hypothetical protein
MLWLVNACICANSSAWLAQTILMIGGRGQAPTMMNDLVTACPISVGLVDSCPHSRLAQVVVGLQYFCAELP